MTFIRDDVLPSYWANAIQRLLSTYSDFILSRASPTAIQIVASPNEGAAVCTVEGKWRFVEATVSRAHPGGAAGTYDIFATTAANDVTNVPDPFTDHTVYSFALAIVAHGGSPPIVAGVVDHVRKIGELTWDGAQITKVTQLVGVAPPETPLVVGDMKPSLQAADHAGWVLMDGRANLSRASYPPEFAALMDALGLHGVDADHFAVPDWRGRAIVGKGTHADVDTLLDNEGAVVGNRRPGHSHTVAAHSHVVNAHSHGGVTEGSAPGTDAQGGHDHTGATDWVGAGGSRVIFGGSAIGGAINTATDVALGDSVVPPGNSHHHAIAFQGNHSHTVNNHGHGIDNDSPGTTAVAPGTDTVSPAFGVANIFVHTGEAGAAGGGGGGGGGDLLFSNTYVADHTLGPADAGNLAEMDAATDKTFTVPADADWDAPIGTTIELGRMGAGGLTVHPAAGVTIPNRIDPTGAADRTIADQLGAGSLRKRAANTWWLIGDLA